jgi:hypothetical protein
MPNPLPSLDRSPMVVLHLCSTSPVYRLRAFTSWISVLFLSFHSGVAINWVDATVIRKHHPEEEQESEWRKAESD